jgi:catechol 2,3-dioxygenase-like lactoylglutathione lyase family enzyme
VALAHFEVITLFVADLAACRDFYTRVFGVDVVYSDAVSAVFGFSGTMVNLLAESEAPPLVSPLPVGPGGTRMLLTVKVEDVDAECKRLAGLGIALLNGPIDRPWGRRTAAFADPAGNVWELAHEITALATDRN